MRRALLASLFLLTAVHAAPVWKQSEFTESAEGWTTWSARPETKPRIFVDPITGRSPGGSLAIAGTSHAAAHGGWERRVEGMTPGSWYRFTAHYRADSVTAENWQIVARIDWRTAEGKRAGQPEYVSHLTREGQWTRATTDVPAPANAAAAIVQLYLSNAPTGTVWWDDLSLEQIPAPGKREIRVASVNLRPRGSVSAADSVTRFLETIEQKVPAQTDVILLPEGITVVGTTKTYAEVAEPIPGPTTQRLGELAKKRKAYVVAGIYEREAHTLYNTAVILDRDGRLIGKYRKVYLPREEVERGLTPGNSYPVFQTDFGKVGLMICYDVFFSDPARALATQGAEMILLPIWGGDETLAKARAIENKIFLIASGYDHPTYVMDPNGERLSEAREQSSAAVATIDLNRRYLDGHLGDMRTRRWKEQRTDIAEPVPGLEK